jgi:translation initiation factor IF-3
MLPDARGEPRAAASLTRPPTRGDTDIARPTEPRVNNRIRKSPIRLIGDEGEQLGIVELDDARRRADEAGLDLVEVGPNADPPVVRMMDYGKMRYEKQKREREARKKTHHVELKEVKYRPTIDQHDRDRKTQLAREFLSHGNKVKVTIFFRYRQLRRPELGEEILDRVQRELADVGKVEFRSRGMEGRQMTMVLNPIEGAEKPAQKAT